MVDFMGMGPDSTATSSNTTTNSSGNQAGENQSLNPFTYLLALFINGIMEMGDDGTGNQSDDEKMLAGLKKHQISTLLIFHTSMEVMNSGSSSTNSGEVDETVTTTTEGEAALLRPYGGPGGGHHVPARSVFAGSLEYDVNAAPAIPNAEMFQLGVTHSSVTGAQMTGYRTLARSGGAITWENVATIETNALIRGGMNPSQAQATVNQAINTLKSSGVNNPTNIPWGVVKLQ